MTRENRAGQTRAADNRPERKKVWQRPGRLDAPAPKDGMHYRWIRKSMLGQDDNTNMQMRQREGYEPVPEEELQQMGYPSEVGGLRLCRIDKDIADSRREHFRQQNREQMQAVDSSLMRDAQEDRRMPIQADRRSQTTYGGPRPTRFQDE